MHNSSYLKMKDFILTIGKKNQNIRVLDVGSLDVNGSYRPLIPIEWEYTGADITSGKNVNIVLENQYHWPFESEYFDIVISGQVLEHVSNPFKWIEEIYRILKLNGEVFIVAPSKGKQHHRPDYWRIYPDGMKTLLESVGFNHISVSLDKKSEWGDCCGYGKK